MKRIQEGPERLQQLAAEIEKGVDLWEKLDRSGLSSRVGQKLEELAQVQEQLRKRPGGCTKLESEQIVNLRNMLHQSLRDHGLMPHERVYTRQSPKHSARPDQTYKAIQSKYDSNRLLLQTLLEAKSPREHSSPQNHQTDRVLKYRQKYQRLKHQYNELLEVAKCMEQQVASLEGELDHHRKLHNESLKTLEEIRSENTQLRKQQTLSQAEQLNKQTLLRELKKELESKQNLCYDRDFLEDKLSKYDQLVRKLKLQYEHEAVQAAKSFHELQQKYESVLKDNHSIQELHSRLTIKHEKLCLDYDRKERQCGELEQYELQLREVSAELFALRDELSRRQLSERERVKSIQLIHSKVENERRANLQLEQELVSSIREKKQLMGQLHGQRELKKDIEQIATVVNCLKKENEQLRSNMTRSSRSENKLKVISQLQDMVRLHKLQLKDSRR